MSHMTKRDNETQTEFTLRLIRAEAWDEGATKAAPYGGGYLRSLLIENPYRDYTPTPATTEENPDD